jgi:hypothetical protein
VDGAAVSELKGIRASALTCAEKESLVSGRSLREPEVPTAELIQRSEPTECWVPEVAYLPVFTNWMQSPWFLNVGLVKVCQPLFLHWSLLMGPVWNSTAPISQIPMRGNPS